MRVQVEQRTDGSFRICEADGRLVYSWLPDLEPDDELPIDRGGFETLGDATGFALAIDLIRSEHGLIETTPAAIEQERDKLELRPTTSAPREPKKRADAAVARALARIDARLAAEAAELDREALWSAVEREPVVEYRRQRVA